MKLGQLYLQVLFALSTTIRVALGFPDHLSATPVLPAVTSFSITQTIPLVGTSYILRPCQRLKSSRLFRDIHYTTPVISLFPLFHRPHIAVYPSMKCGWYMTRALTMIWLTTHVQDVQRCRGDEAAFGFVAQCHTNSQGCWI